ncbi:phytanoyl-CoA dioxygenase family protein [Kangiella marina]|uniref:phytanoyl-CoA dioxygenase family protein n=1 Tax=Kangiella marina TaxID=1079178 RepID=UPI0031F05F37
MKITRGNFERSDLAREELIQLKKSNLKDIAKQVKQDGYSVDLKLSPAVVNEIFYFCNTQPCYALRNPRWGFYLKDLKLAEEAIGKNILLAQYFNAQDELPILDKVIRSPVIHAITQQYLGNRYKFVGCNLWWTFPTRASEEDRKKHAHYFHRDVDDFKFIKFFFYITDVDESSGPHVFVKGSHNRCKENKWKNLFRNRRYEDSEIVELYGEQSIIEMLGNSGDVIIEDTYGFHKGSTPISSPRLIFQIQFALFDYGVQNDTIDKLELIIKD